MTGRFCALYPVVTSYIAKTQYSNEEININTYFLSWNFKIHKNVERIGPYLIPLSYLGILTV